MHAAPFGWPTDVPILSCFSCAQAFTALAEWEDPEKENTQEAKTAEGQKARLEERQKIMEVKNMVTFCHRLSWSECMF